MSFSDLKSCVHCKNYFPPGDGKSLFCSKKCRDAFNGESIKSYPGLKTSKGTIGAISEMRVCVDLLLKGYDVFRAVSPSCSCDLIALKGDRKIRVEVRTGSVSARTGKRQCRKSARDEGRYDCYAFCYHDSIVYEPELP